MGYSIMPVASSSEDQTCCRHIAACSRNLVLKQCLRLPTPLWEEIMSLLGGQFTRMAQEARKQNPWTARIGTTVEAQIISPRFIPQCSIFFRCAPYNLLSSVRRAKCFGWSSAVLGNASDWSNCLSKLSVPPAVACKLTNVLIVKILLYFEGTYELHLIMMTRVIAKNLRWDLYQHDFLSIHMVVNIPFHLPVLKQRCTAKWAASYFYRAHPWHMTLSFLAESLIKWPQIHVCAWQWLHLSISLSSLISQCTLDPSRGLQAEAERCIHTIYLTIQYSINICSFEASWVAHAIKILQIISLLQDTGSCTMLAIQLILSAESLTHCWWRTQ